MMKSARAALFASGVELGKLESIECPDCHQQTVSVWFSHPSTEYRTWFLCKNCPFEMRVQNTTKPGFYTDERLSH